MKVPDGMVRFAGKTLGFLPEAEVELTPLAGRGSDRSYYRLRWNGDQSAILAHYSPLRKENACFVEIARFLDSIAIPTAKIVGHEPSDCFIIMQDLGDIDLWSLRHLPWEKRRTLYQKALSSAQHLHTFPAHLVPTGQVQLAEAFGPDLYRWERDYFMKNYVDRICGIDLKPDFRQELETELTALAERLSLIPRCLVHRDLQSQNVMICNDEPFFIDFQGMRFGTLFYDLGSLLYDPYVAFSENERDVLLRFYYRISEEAMDWDRFRENFMEASAQRLMQALGAYGYLGITKGLRDYLVHIQPGLEHLILAVQNAGTLPCLRELVIQCRDYSSAEMK